jgi:2-oxoglutarate dehydrogenase E2 component (dihydrolipoamide succinyltransferase)
VKILFEKDQVAQVGDVIAILSTGGESTPSTSNTVVSTPEVKIEMPKATDSVTQNGQVEKLSKNSETGKFLSPLVRSIAEKEGISQNQLDSIAGTGQDGRITKKDILLFLETKTDVIAAPVSQAIVKEVVSTPSSTPQVVTTNSIGGNFLSNIKEPIVMPNPGDEIIEMDRMRKLIADHMLMSVHVSPHVTSYVEADVTNIVNWRNKVKKKFLETITSIISCILMPTESRRLQSQTQFRYSMKRQAPYRFIRRVLGHCIIFAIK